jgi:predicted TIM-barrel fold metal-dependent hydrolase
LKEYALAELERCSKLPLMKGLKLHFGNSGVELRNPEHVKKVQRVFAAADALRMPIVVHLWTLNPRYGGEDARIFLDKVLPEAAHVTVQIAHLAGGGRSTPAAMQVYADAIARHDLRTQHVYFDVATSTEGENSEGLNKDAEFIRQVGPQRVLYGTDTSPPNPPARVSWAMFRALVPLTDDEFRTIASNVLEYLH